MKKENALKKEGNKSAIFRGHNMTKFKKDGRLFESTCKNCGAMLWVIINPAPNEINLCGSAISINCNKKQ